MSPSRHIQAAADRFGRFVESPLAGRVAVALIFGAWSVLTLFAVDAVARAPGLRLMRADRRQALREIMQHAWRKFRWERTGARPVTFADALRHAWAWVKGEADRIAAKARHEASPACRTVYLRTPGASPIRRALSGPYASRNAWDAGRLTTALGR